MRRLLALSAALLLASSVTVQAKPVLTKAQIVAIKGALKEGIPDYEGGRYDRAYAMKSSDGDGTGGLCFHANLKNGFGGYSGWHWYYIVFDGGQPSRLADDDQGNLLCSAAITQPEFHDEYNHHNYARALFPKRRIMTAN